MISRRVRWDQTSPAYNSAGRSPAEGGMVRCSPAISETTFSASRTRRSDGDACDPAAAQSTASPSDTASASRVKSTGSTVGIVCRRPASHGRPLAALLAALRLLGQRPAGTVLAAQELVRLVGIRGPHVRRVVV